MAQVVLRDGRVIETCDEIMRLPHDDDPEKITKSGSEFEALCEEFDLLVGRNRVVQLPIIGDLEMQWKRHNRKAWMEYRAWEDKHIPQDGYVLKDPPGLAEARRAFEKQQLKERERFFKKARYGGRG